MKYSPDLVKEIVKELEKVPNIRHASKKFGIHHSTFYRWMLTHVDFNKQVEAALFMGRKNISDAAESVVISGIQRGELGSAKYWLSHNDERYMTSKQASHSRELEDFVLETLEMKVPEMLENPTFDKIFEMLIYIEDRYKPEIVKVKTKRFLEHFCKGDAELIEIFYTMFTKWKKDKSEHQQRSEDMQYTDEDLWKE